MAPRFGVDALRVFFRYSGEDLDFSARETVTLGMSIAHHQPNPLRLLRGSQKAEGIGLMVRNAHAKGYGLARGEVEILTGIPKEYAQGIYAKPGRHEAMARFSNGTSHVGDDRFLGPITG